MIQVQRFNKALKLAVILGDLVILNVLFIMERVVWGEGLQWHFTPNSNSIQRMLFCVHYLRRCHITSTRSPCRSNCIPGTP